MGFIAGHGGGAQTKSKVRDLAYIVCRDSFIFIDKYILFCKRYLFLILTRK